MVNQIFSPEVQLNKANISDTEAPFLGLSSDTESINFRSTPQVYIFLFQMDLFPLKFVISAMTLILIK